MNTPNVAKPAPRRTRSKGGRDVTLFLVEQETRIPTSIYKKLSPTNPFAKVGWFRALDLATSGLLVATVKGEGLAGKPNDLWLLAFELLETKGIRKGISFREVAEAADCKPEQAKRAMLKAEKLIYELFGFNICFADHNGIWKLATEEEVAKKYARMALEMQSKYERMRLYLPHMLMQGEKKASLMVDLFALPEPTKEGGEGNDGQAAD